MPRSIVALYWEGISIKADRAKSVSFLLESTLLDIISVKFTNYMQPKLKYSHFSKMVGGIMAKWITPNLKIVKCSGWNVVIKFPHHFPRSITNPHQNYWKWILTAMLREYKNAACPFLIRENNKILPRFYNCINCLLFLWT